MIIFWYKRIMPYPVNKIIHHRDYTTFYQSLEFPLEETVEYPYIAGEMQTLIPDGAAFDITKAPVIENPLFNRADLCKLVIPVGEGDIYYLELREDHILDQVIVEPAEVVVDIFYGDGTLIYSFYNPVGTDHGYIILTAKLIEDTEGVYSKIKSDPADPIWRQYFIRRALARLDGSGQPPPKQYPDYMTAMQAADYLQVKEKTIRNWTSQGKIPASKIGGTVRYNKTALDKEMAPNKANK